MAENDDVLAPSRSILVGALVMAGAVTGALVGLSVNLVTAIMRVLPMLAGVAPC